MSSEKSSAISSAISSNVSSKEKSNIDEKISHFTRIISNLYLTGASGISDYNIRHFDIKLLICLATHPKLKGVHGLYKLKIKVPDTPTTNLAKYFEPATKEIDEMRKKGHGVAVHCRKGSSRSTTIVLAYLMRYMNLNLYKAWKLVKTKRPIVVPNHGFLRQLMRYERKLFGSNTVQLVIRYNKKGVAIPRLQKIKEK